MLATGGTITTSGDFKIHTFTGPGTFTVICAGQLQVKYSRLFSSSRWWWWWWSTIGGGGGAGGFRESKSAQVAYTASL